MNRIFCVSLILLTGLFAPATLSATTVSAMDEKASASMMGVLDPAMGEKASASMAGVLASAIGEGEKASASMVGKLTSEMGEKASASVMGLAVASTDGQNANADKPFLPYMLMKAKFTQSLQGAAYCPETDEIFQCQSGGYCRVFSFKDSKKFKYKADVNMPAAEAEAAFEPIECEMTGELQLLPADANVHCNFIYFGPKMKVADDFGTVAGAEIAVGEGTAAGAGIAVGEGTAAGAGIAVGEGTAAGAGIAVGKGTATGAGIAVGEGTAMGNGTSMEAKSAMGEGTATGAGIAVGEGTAARNETAGKNAVKCHKERLLWYGADWGKYEIYAASINRDGDKLSTTLRHTIVIPEASGYFTDFMADFSHNVGYVASYVKPSWKDGKDNAVRITAYSIPFNNLPERFKAGAPIAEFTLPYLPAMQCCMFIKGKLYLGFGFGGKKAFDASIMVINPKTQELERTINVRDYVPYYQELEGIFMKGNSLFVTTGAKKIYKIDLKY